MKIMLLSSAYNSLTQLAHVWLKSSRYEVYAAAVANAEEMREAVRQFRPDLILCPMLTKAIPRDIWENITCIIIHPGIIGDRGPNSLDWAILNQENAWGVIAVEAAEQMDSGPIWANYQFPMREASKSSLYRDEVAQAAMKAMMVAMHRFESGLFVPAPLDYSKPETKGRYRPAVKAAQRQIDWQNDRVNDILRKIRSADGCPGVLDEIGGQPFYLYGAHREGGMVGVPGDIIGKRHGAICRAAVDGAVWISHLRPFGNLSDGFIKLPATLALAEAAPELMAKVPEISVPLHRVCSTETFRDIWYEESNDVGYINFRFYNGAMGTDHCQRLAEAVMYARSRPTKVIVLSGGRDFFSNGIHLNMIEAAEDPAEESWLNINAMDDLVLALLNATEHFVIASLYGSAGAGGVMVALATDWVLARQGIVLNPHYKGMGGLYGSEYWTYTLPKRVGKELALQLTEQCQPISVEYAKAIGLIDDIIIQDDFAPSNYEGFQQQIERIAEKITQREDFSQLIDLKRRTRQTDEQAKPLEQYRLEELEEMNQNFWGDDQSYHIARRAFVRKLPRPGNLNCTPAIHSICSNPHCEEANHAGANRCAFATVERASIRVAQG